MTNEEKAIEIANNDGLYNIENGCIEDCRIAALEMAKWKDGSEKEVEEETIGQFTGFLDAHGQEIYEGDILYVPEDTFNSEMLCVVEWNNDGFIARSVRSSTSSILSWALKKDHATKHYVRQVKVIGNIHDNPELIKEK